MGVTAGQGQWQDAFGALMLFLSNVVALVIAGSIVFTLGGYALDPSSRREANRRRAYVVVTLLAVIVSVPLAANSIATIALARWSVAIQDAATEWLKEEPGARVYDVQWSGLTATLDVTTDDGSVPSVDDLDDTLSASIPSFVGVVLDVGQGVEYVVR